MKSARKVVAAVVTVLFVVSACSSGADDGPDASSASADEAFPVTIDSTVGTATIEQQPKRVVTIGWGSQDAALALGVVPVAMQDMSGDTGDDTGILPWDAPELGGQEPTLLKYATNEVPFEEIAELRPDVILAVNSGLTDAEYARLSQIAPTVGYPGKPWLTSWQDQLDLVGKALGRSEEAAALKQSTEQLIAKAKKDHPEFAGKTVAFGSGTVDDSFNLYLASDSRVELLHDLGFEIAPSLPTKADSFAAQLSLEKLGEIDADVLVAWYLSPSIQEGLEGTSLFTSVPAVERGGYVPLTDPAMVYATSAVSVLSLPWMLDRYLPLLSDAAKGKS